MKNYRQIIINHINIRLTKIIFSQKETKIE